jgi:predicted HicB family RNase H-like nuclease
MSSSDRQRPQTRMVHVRLSEELHKQLRIRAAESDVTLQDWVTMAIQHEFNRIENLKEKGSG